MARKATDTVQLKLRMREELRRKLERAATKKEHSLNTEMIDRLEASFADEGKARDQNQMLEAIGGTLKSVIENHRQRTKVYLAEETMNQIRIWRDTGNEAHLPHIKAAERYLEALLEDSLMQIKKEEGEE